MASKNPGKESLESLTRGWEFHLQAPLESSNNDSTGEQTNFICHGVHEILLEILGEKGTFSQILWWDCLDSVDTTALKMVSLANICKKFLEHWVFDCPNCITQKGISANTSFCNHTQVVSCLFARRSVCNASPSVLCFLFWLNLQPQSQLSHGSRQLWSCLAIPRSWDQCYRPHSS